MQSKCIWLKKRCTWPPKHRTSNIYLCCYFRSEPMPILLSYVIFTSSLQHSLHLKHSSLILNQTFHFFFLWTVRYCYVLSFRLVINNSVYRVAFWDKSSFQSPRFQSGCTVFIIFAFSKIKFERKHCMQFYKGTRWILVKKPWESSESRKVLEQERKL